VEAGLVDDQGHRIAGVGAYSPGEDLECPLEYFSVDLRQNQPDQLTSGGLDESVDIKPLIPRPLDDDRTLSFTRPDSTQDRLETKPCLVLGENPYAVDFLGL